MSQLVVSTLDGVSFGAMGRATLLALSGLLVGTCLGFAIVSYGGVLEGGVPTPERPIRSSESAGARLMAEVGRKFVARSTSDGLTFYDEPKPYGDWLCRVNAYQIHRKVVTGKIEREQDWWGDNLQLERMYSVWSRPTKGSPPNGAREKACAAFRDFKHMFAEDGLLSAERGAFLLDTVLTGLRSGKLPVHPSCYSFGHNGTVTVCDARAVLSRVSLKDLYLVSAVSKQDIANGERHVDELSIASPNAQRRRLLTMRVTSDQIYGTHSISEGVVTSVNVEVEEIGAH